MFDCKEISGVFNKLMASGNKDLLLFGGIFRKLDIIGSEDTSSRFKMSVKLSSLEVFRAKFNLKRLISLFLASWASSDNNPIGTQNEAIMTEPCSNTLCTDVGIGYQGYNDTHSSAVSVA